MNKKISVKNLPPQMSTEEIRRMFSRVGMIEAIKIDPPTETEATQTGHLTMSSYEEASAAVRKFHGKNLDGFQLTVEEVVDLKKYFANVA